MKTRINKYLALCGLGSRRKVEEIILQRRITVNGVETFDLACQIDTDRDEVCLDGKRVIPYDRFYYLILNKPKGYITTLQDEQGRPIVMDLIMEKYIRAGVFPVGRLDKDSEGLLILTNDGELANVLTHPNFSVPKEYFVELNKPLDQKIKERIERGVMLYSRKTKPAEIQYLDQSGKQIRMTISEGKKRQIRVIFQNFHYRVKKLKRTAYGPLKLTGIPSGTFRLMRPREISALKKMTHS